MPLIGINDFRMSGKSRVTKLSTAEKLSPRAYQIMDFHLQGVQSKDIASRLGMNARYVGEILNAPNFQHMLAIRRGQIQENLDGRIADTTVDAANELKAHAKEAADRLVDLLDSNSEPIQLKSSREILDRAGVVSQEKGSSASATVVVVDEKAARLIKETFQMDEEEVDGK